MAKKIPVKLILELRAAKLSMRKIAASRHISRHSVSEVFRIASEREISYQHIRDMEDEELYQMFFPEKHFMKTMFEPPDYEKVHQQLKKTGVTLKLLWEEYTESCQAKETVPMGYSKFREGYREFTISNRLTNHIDHRPGERVEVDWSGKTMSYTPLPEIRWKYIFSLPHCPTASIPTLHLRLSQILCKLHIVM